MVSTPEFYSPLALTPSTGPHIVLIRHGETEWSLTGRHTGLTEVPLTERGRRQAVGAGEIIRGLRFGAVLSSPLQRARQTAELAGFPDALDEPDLVEWDYGAYEGLTTTEIRQSADPSWTVWDGVPPGASPGESLDQVRSRAEAVIARLRPTLDAGEDALVFAHSHMLRVFASAWLGPRDAGERLYLGTGSVSALATEHGTPVVAAWNLAPMV